MGVRPMPTSTLRQIRAIVLVVVIALASSATPAPAFDAAASFARGTKIFSLQAGGGSQEFSRAGETTDITFFNITPRLSLIPLEPFGPSWLPSALETGLEGWLQRYVEPHDATAGGLKAVVRYHLLGFDRLVPYLEAGAGLGGSDLEVLGHRSRFTFILEGGVGLSIMLTDHLALTAGYRYQHLSNGGLEKPNRGYDAHTGTVGVSIFFP